MKIREDNNERLDKELNYDTANDCEKDHESRLTALRRNEATRLKRESNEEETSESTHEEESNSEEEH